MVKEALREESKAKEIAFNEYQKLAGEIEASDVANRDDLSAEEIKNTRPDIDNPNVVFADGSSVSYFAKSEYNAETAVASDTVKKIERLGKLDGDKITLFGANKEAENTLLRTLNAENTQKSTLTNTKQGNKNVSDSGERSAITKERYTEYDKPISGDDAKVLHKFAGKSINRLTITEMEKAQKWAHKFYKELGSKSPFFRAWFGEWRAHDKSQRKIVSVPTIDVSQVELATGDYTIVDTGWTVYAGKTLNDDTRHHTGGNRVNVKSLSAIEKILNNAILLDTVVSEPDQKKKSSNTAFLHKLYTLITYNNQTYIAKTTVEEYYNETTKGVSRKAYNLKAIKIEPAGGQLGKKSSSSVPATDSMYSISDLYEFVKTYDKDFTPAPEISPLMLNKDKTPRVVYHGTNAEFNVFEKGHKRTRGRLNFGEGFYFAVSKDYAQDYIEGEGGKVVEAYVSLKNPYNVVGYDFTEWEMDDIRSKLPVADRAKLDYDNVNDYLAKLGYDGIIGLNYSGTTKTVKIVVAFEPTQIKSATDNIGTFDRSNPDIRYALKKSDKEYRDEVKVKADEKIAKATAKAEAKYERATETAKARLEAEYRTDTTFSEASVKKSFDSVEAISKLKKAKREEIARELWLELQASDDAAVRDSFVLKYSVKLYDEIRRADYDAYDNMTYGERDALKSELEAMMKKVIKSGKKSKWAKQKDDVRGAYSITINYPPNTQMSRILYYHKLYAKHADEPHTLLPQIIRKTRR